MFAMRKQHEPAYSPKIRSKWYFLVEKAGKPLRDRKEPLFPEDIATDDPWQFKNFRVM